MWVTLDLRGLLQDKKLAKEFHLFVVLHFVNLQKISLVLSNLLHSIQAKFQLLRSFWSDKSCRDFNQTWRLSLDLRFSAKDLFTLLTTRFYKTQKVPRKLLLKIRHGQHTTRKSARNMKSCTFRFCMWSMIWIINGLLLYNASQKHESTLLHTYLCTVRIFDSRPSCTTKYFWRRHCRSW